MERLAPANPAAMTPAAHFVERVVEKSQRCGQRATPMDAGGG
jgi:hypothetical protein